MNFHETTIRLNQLIAEMNAIDFGYPLGDNVVAVPQDPVFVEERLATIGGDAVAAFFDFYRCCDGLSLPDIHNGYFIKAIAKLGMSRPDSDPTQVMGDYAGAVLAFGSTGNGGLFVVRRIESDVLYLPPGPLHDGVYDGRQTQVKRLAPDLNSFLGLLLDDVEAFVRDTPHQYIA